jgi:hypothetical protein
MRSPGDQCIGETERVTTVRCMVAAFAIAALLVSLIYGMA